MALNDTVTLFLDGTAGDGTPVRYQADRQVTTVRPLSLTVAQVDILKFLDGRIDGYYRVVPYSTRRRAFIRALQEQESAHLDLRVHRGSAEQPLPAPVVRANGAIIGDGGLLDPASEEAEARATYSDAANGDEITYAWIGTVSTHTQTYKVADPTRLPADYVDHDFIAKNTGGDVIVSYSVRHGGLEPTIPSATLTFAIDSAAQTLPAPVAVDAANGELDGSLTKTTILIPAGAALKHQDTVTLSLAIASGKSVTIKHVIQSTEAGIALTLPVDGNTIANSRGRDVVIRYDVLRAISGKTEPSDPSSFHVTGDRTTRFDFEDVPDTTFNAMNPFWTEDFIIVGSDSHMGRSTWKVGKIESNPPYTEGRGVDSGFAGSFCVVPLRPCRRLRWGQYDKSSRDLRVTTYMGLNTDPVTTRVENPGWFDFQAGEAIRCSHYYHVYDPHAQFDNLEFTWMEEESPSSLPGHVIVDFENIPDGTRLGSAAPLRMEHLTITSQTRPISRYEPDLSSGRVTSAAVGYPHLEGMAVFADCGTEGGGLSVSLRRPCRSIRIGVHASGSSCIATVYTTNSQEGIKLNVADGFSWLEYTAPLGVGLIRTVSLEQERRGEIVIDNITLTYD